MVDDQHTEPVSVDEAVDAAETVEETYFETFQRLARLSLIEYDRCRKAEADRLDIRVGTLDKEVQSARPRDDDGNDLGLTEPAPSPEEVDGDDLLNRIIEGLCRYVVMPPHVAEAIALWCVHTYVFEFWQHTPRLAISSPTKGCAKSLLADVIACLVPRALQTDSLSEAVAFRLAESHKPVFLIDECDSHLSSKNPDDGLRGILNSGHSKGKRALRCVGDTHEVKGFRTFTPVAMAGIGNLPPTLVDRSIRVVLQKRTKDERVENFRVERTEHLRQTASQIARWTEDNGERLHQIDPVMPDGLFNRRADVWRPLLAIADVVGGNWPERARQAAAVLENNDTGDDEITIQLLTDIRDAFEQHGDDKMPSTKLAEYLNEQEARPWPEYGRGRKPISTVQIARLLRRHTIPPNTIRMGDKIAKGYRLNQFKDTFARYLPSFETLRRYNPQETAEKQPFQGVTSTPNVTGQKPLKPAATLTCDGVTDGNGVSGDERLFRALETLDDDPEERAAIQEFDGEFDPIGDRQ